MQISPQSTYKLLFLRRWSFCNSKFILLVSCLSRFRLLRSYLVFNEIPHRLGQKVTRFLQHQFSLKQQAKTADLHVPLLDLLSHQLQASAPLSQEPSQSVQVSLRFCKFFDQDVYILCVFCILHRGSSSLPGTGLPSPSSNSWTSGGQGKGNAQRSFFFLGWCWILLEEYSNIREVWRGV